MRILLLISLIAFNILARVKTDKIQAKDSVIVVEDSTYFAGGLRGPRLYMQTASVDSFKKSFVVRGNVFGFSQTAGSCPFTSYGTTNKINGYFGTLSNNDGGVICYDSSGTARIKLPTRGSGYILGSIAINQTTPDSNLTVGGSAHVTGNARIDGGLRLGSGDLLSVYDTGSFACTTTTAYLTVAAIGIVRYTIIGNAVTLRINGPLSGTSNSTDFTINAGGMPANALPDSVVSGSGSYVYDNGSPYGSLWDLVPSTKKITINKYNVAAFQASGIKGINVAYGKGYIIHYNRR